MSILAIENLTMQFGGLVAVNDFSMNVEQGTIHALIGPNGAGKSTVFNCISRFCSPQRGAITFDGHSVLALQEHEIVRIGIARTFQNLEQLHRMTVLECVLVGLTSKVSGYVPFLPSPSRSTAEKGAVRDAEEILERTGLSDYRDAMAGELDFGRQKILDVARALSAKPSLLLLDEPAAGLRNREISFVDDLLVDLARRQGITVVLVEHVMQLVMSVADTITVLNFGEKISEGSPAAVRGDQKVVEAYLGTPAHA